MARKNGASTTVSKEKNVNGGEAGGEEKQDGGRSAEVVNASVDTEMRKYLL